MFKYFIIGFVSCLVILLSLVFVLVKFVYPILEKLNYQKSCNRLYELCQELIHH